MNRSKVAVLVAALLMAAAFGFGQDLTIASLSEAPTVDGTVGNGEYGLSLKLEGMTFHAGERDGSLYVAVVAETAGWVAVGFNSIRMQGADIVIAYDTGDSQSVQEHAGRGHRHQRTQDGILSQSAVAEADGMTVLEVEVPLSAVREGSSQNLEFITGYGARDNVTQYHTFRSPVRAQLE